MAFTVAMTSIFGIISVALRTMRFIASPQWTSFKIFTNQNRL